MNVYRHKLFTGKRKHYDTGQIAFVIADSNPNKKWFEPSSQDALESSGARPLWLQAGVRYWGWL